MDVKPLLSLLHEHTPLPTVLCQLIVEYCNYDRAVIAYYAETYNGATQIRRSRMIQIDDEGNVDSSPSDDLVAVDSNHIKVQLSSGLFTVRINRDVNSITLFELKTGSFTSIHPPTLRLDGGCVLATTIICYDGSQKILCWKNLDPDTPFKEGKRGNELEDGKGNEWKSTSYAHHPVVANTLSSVWNFVPCNDTLYWLSYDDCGKRRFIPIITLTQDGQLKMTDKSFDLDILCRHYYANSIADHRGGKIYTLYLDVFECYDLKTGTNRRIAPPPTCRTSTHMPLHIERLVTVGSNLLVSTSDNRLHIYNTRTDTWSPVSNLPFDLSVKPFLL